jgi:hypothetical protein
MEKDYIFGRLLAGIAQHEALMNTRVFKAGLDAGSVARETLGLRL